MRTPAYLSQSPTSSSFADACASPTPRGLGEANSPGHRLLPRWDSFTSALPKLGEVCVVSRNHHAVMGGICIYPSEVDDGVDCQFHPQFDDWSEAWFYREHVNGVELTGFEIRDSEDIGFHKIILTENSDRDFAQTLARALEEAPLQSETINSAVKANHLDGVCCADCQARASEQAQGHTCSLMAFINWGIDQQLPMRAILMHRGMVAVRRFVPTLMQPQENWHSISGGGVSLFIRLTSVGSVEIEALWVADVGFCRIATLRDLRGDLIISLLIEESAD
jgi:hypothetical protein